MMNPQRSLSTTLLLPLLAWAGIASVYGQQAAVGGRNNPYSPSPSHWKAQPQTPTPESRSEVGPNNAVFIAEPVATLQMSDPPIVVQKEIHLPRPAEITSRPPTEVYKVGVGDVLFINLKNAAEGSRYSTVRENGMIDFPLAGDALLVIGKTTDEIAAMLAANITLFCEPHVEVKVREFASHQITVSGLVENSGRRYLQREAIPLFVIKAQVQVLSTATAVSITRAPLLKPEVYDLRDAATDSVLVYAGNSLEFKTDGRSAGNYFITGDQVLNPGQRELRPGLTLYQAIITSGSRKALPKKAVLRHRSEAGVFVSTEHNIKSIREGKARDPELASGDVIEVRHD